MGKEWHTVGLPQELFEEVREMIFKKPYLGYRNPNEYVREAVREKVSRDSLKTSHQKKYEEEWV